MSINQKKKTQKECPACLQRRNSHAINCPINVRQSVINFLEAEEKHKHAKKTAKNIAETAKEWSEAKRSLKQSVGLQEKK